MGEKGGGGGRVVELDIESYKYAFWVFDQAVEFKKRKNCDKFQNIQIPPLRLLKMLLLCSCIFSILLLVTDLDASLKFWMIFLLLF